MNNLAIYSPLKTEQIDVGQVLLTNQFLNAEIKRLKEELQESKATIYQQKKTISEQARTINNLNKKVIKVLEKDKVVFNKDKVTFIQAFGMKCSEKSILGHLRNFLGHEPTWENLNADNLQRFNSWLKKSAKTKRGTLLNDSTACTYVAQLRQVIKYGYTDSNDSSNALKSSRPAKKKKVWLKGSALNKLIQYNPIDLEEKKARCTFLICAITGCRVSDAPTIKLENIDGDTLRYIPIKTKNQECYVKLSGNARTLLKELILEAQNIGYSDNNIVLKKIFRDLGFTHKVSIGTPNKPDIVEFCEAISYHTARRSFATNLYRYSALTERDIATAMGHSSFSQTYDNYIVDKSAITDGEKRENLGSVFC